MPNDIHSHVSIVDDDQAIPKALAILLRSFGFDVTCFCSGAELLRYPELRSVEVVVSDIQMPQMSGLELARELRLRAPELPVILMTGNVGVAMTAAASDCGATSIIKKPIKLDELLLAIRNVLSNPIPTHSSDS